MTDFPASGRGALLVLSTALLVVTGCVPSSDRQVDEQKEPYYQTGIGRLNGRDFVGAIEAFEKALEVNPRSGLAHLQLGRLYEEHVTNAAAAIHHYEKFLRYTPKSDQAQIVRGRIEGCKIALAQPYLVTPATQNAMQREIDRLTLENNLLRKQAVELRESLARATATPPPVYVPTPETTTIAPRPSPPPVPTESPNLLRSSTVPRPETATSSPPRTATRTYTVRPGDSLYSIARRYHISVSALQSANPGVSARALKAGQTLKIPAP
jgi:LysM repeat protein